MGARARGTRARKICFCARPTARPAAGYMSHSLSAQRWRAKLQHLHRDECLTLERIARNIISVGDSMHELSALKSVTKEPTCCGKSIKLLENPSIEQIIEQHDVVASSLLEVAEHNGDLDIEVGVD